MAFWIPTPSEALADVSVKNMHNCLNRVQSLKNGDESCSIQKTRLLDRMHLESEANCIQSAVMATPCQ